MRLRGVLFFGLVLGVLSVFAFGYVRSQSTLPRPAPSFVNGQTFLDWSENQRDIYTMGLIDGFGTGAGLADDSYRLYQRALPIQCFKGMSSGQVRAIIEKFLRENPEMWDRSMSSLGWNAMERACKLR